MYIEFTHAIAFHVTFLIYQLYSYALFNFLIDDKSHYMIDAVLCDWRLKMVESIKSRDEVDYFHSLRSYLFLICINVKIKNELNGGVGKSLMELIFQDSENAYIL